MSAEISYADEPRLAAAEFIDLLRRSTLAERRPVDDAVRIARMLKEADIILCARDRAGLLVGVSRAITDFSYCCYLSDLAVDRDRQRGGIGRELIRLTHAKAGEETMLILLSAPKALGYYPHIGMAHSDRAFTLDRRR
jgi:GNAT superfamily N-acetyltransferase